MHTYVHHTSMNGTLHFIILNASTPHTLKPSKHPWFNILFPHIYHGREALFPLTKDQVSSTSLSFSRKQVRGTNDSSSSSNFRTLDPYNTTLSKKLLKIIITILGSKSSSSSFQRHTKNNQGEVHTPIIFEFYMRLGGDTSQNTFTLWILACTNLFEK